MGNDHSKKEVNAIDFDKKLYIEIDIHLKSKYDNELINDELKTNHFLKKHLKEIITNGFVKANCDVSIHDCNLWLISKKDKNDIDCLELNAIAEFNGKSKNISSDINMQTIKMHILSEFYTYTSKKYWIMIGRDTGVIILYNTLYAIDLYQKI